MIPSAIPSDLAEALDLTMQMLDPDVKLALDKDHELQDDYRFHEAKGEDIFM